MKSSRLVLLSRIMVCRPYASPREQDLLLLLLASLISSHLISSLISHLEIRVARFFILSFSSVFVWGEEGTFELVCGLEDMDVARDERFAPPEGLRQNGLTSSSFGGGGRLGLCRLLFLDSLQHGGENSLLLCSFFPEKKSPHLNLNADLSLGQEAIFQCFYLKFPFCFFSLGERR